MDKKEKVKRNEILTEAKERLEELSNDEDIIVMFSKEHIQNFSV